MTQKHTQEGEQEDFYLVFSGVIEENKICKAFLAYFLIDWMQIFILIRI